MDWQDCSRKRIAKSVTPDIDMIKALTKTSDNKWTSQELLPLTKDTAASKISLAYDSLRELLEVLALKKGFKIYNHECYTAFLKEIVLDSEKGDEFDTLRKLRNAINYYGKDINEEEAKEAINRIKTLRDFILKMI